MKKKIIILLLISILGSFSLTSCQNDDPTNEELLTEHAWFGIVKEYYVNNDLEETTDISSMKMILNTDDSYKVYNGNTLVEQGTWGLTPDDDNQIVFITNQLVSNKLTITKLTETALEMYNEQENNGDTEKLVFKFKD